MHQSIEGDVRVAGIVDWGGVMRDEGMEVAVLRKALLRPDEVAALLRCSRQHVYNLVGRGVLEGLPIRPLRIKTSSLLRLLGGPQISPSES